VKKTAYHLALKNKKEARELEKVSAFSREAMPAPQNEADALRPQRRTSHLPQASTAQPERPVERAAWVTDGRHILQPESRKQVVGVIPAAHVHQNQAGPSRFDLISQFRNAG
jgi:hypothetical protein